MKIEIEKRTIKVDKNEFVSEIRQICLLYKEFKRSIFAIGYITFKKELKLKISELEFYQLCKECNLKFWRSNILIEQFSDNAIDK